MSVKKQVILCGWNESSENILAELSFGFDKMEVTLVSDIIPKKLNYPVTCIDKDPGIPSVYSSRKIDLNKADICVIFAQKKGAESDSDTDLRNYLILYTIKQINPDVHCIIELYNQNQADFVMNDLKADEIVPKNSIDSDLIFNSLMIPGISSMIYQIYNQEGYTLKEITLSNIGLEEGTSYNEARKVCMEGRMTLLGFLRGKRHLLSPDGDTAVNNGDRLVVIGIAK